MAGYSGDAGDALAAAQTPAYRANGMMFSTPDSDNDERPDGQCAKFSGWWFSYCGTSNINKRTNSIWVTGSAVWNVQASRMLVKLN